MCSRRMLFLRIFSATENGKNTKRIKNCLCYLLHNLTIFFFYHLSNCSQEHCLPIAHPLRMALAMSKQWVSNAIMGEKNL
jgi:hypothetical protein